ncbi:MAG: hypothetical protein KJ927_02805, partial [Candidatus Eisenbacteria bacterium]|nr:hypothetical protein [Candidatus Eisenbacteria bacterium]
MIKLRERQSEMFWGWVLLLSAMPFLWAAADPSTAFDSPSGAEAHSAADSISTADSINTADSLSYAGTEFVQVDSAAAPQRSGLEETGPRIRTVFADGRADRLDALTRFGDDLYAPIDRLIWAISGNLAWNLGTLRGNIVWDSLSVSFAVGSCVLHAGERALTMEHPILLSPQGLYYPFPDFIHALNDVSVGRIEYEEEIQTLFLIPPEPDEIRFIQEEVGHQFIIRCSFEAEPVVHPSWDGRGYFTIDLENVQTDPRLLSLPDAGEYAQLLKISPTSAGTRLEFFLERTIVGWAVSWDELSSEWKITFTTSLREVSRLRMPLLEWDSDPAGLFMDGPIIIELKMGCNPSNQAARFMEALTESVSSLLQARLGVDVARVNATSRNSALKNVEAANSKKASLFLSLALDLYNEQVPRGLAAVIPLPRPPVPLFSGTSENDGMPGSMDAFAPAAGTDLIPWDESTDRHYHSSLYLARLMAAILSGDEETRVERRPMADLVGLDMPVVRLFIGRQSPQWKEGEVFPGSDDWES